MVLDKRVPVERLMQTIMISCERLPRCSNAIGKRCSTPRCRPRARPRGRRRDRAGLPDPVRRQGAARHRLQGLQHPGGALGITITGAVVREGDEFDYELGSNATCATSRCELGKDRRIIGAWACATSNTRPPSSRSWASTN
jgi:hypothetical protein